MYATMFLMIFLLFIPKTIKDAGIRMIIDGKKQGLFIFLFSKVLWWFLFVQIINIWFTGVFLNILYVAVILGFSYRIYKEKRYLEIAIRKKRIIEKNQV